MVMESLLHFKVVPNNLMSLAESVEPPMSLQDYFRAEMKSCENTYVARCVEIYPRGHYINVGDEDLGI